MMSSIDRRKGKVKWFDSKKGYGFLTPEGSDGDLFVHKSSIKGVGVRSLSAGQAVEFVVSVGYDGRSSAANVTGPGGVCIQGRHFGGACFLCNKVGHMARDCNRVGSVLGIGPCYHCGKAGHLASQCTAFPFTNIMDRLKLDLGSSSNLLADEIHSQICLGMGCEPQSVEEWRNWAELPSDILMVIFKKITVYEVLIAAQFVCKPWRQLSFVPALWRCIDMQMYDFLDNMEALAIMAVDRSEGCLEELHLEYFPTEKIMYHIAERAPLLRRLHLISVCLEDITLIQVLKKFPLLEVLEILNTSFTDEIVAEIGQACSELKSFSFNEREYKLSLSDFHRIQTSNVDMEAFAIAKHMKQLHRLQLFGNGLSRAGLVAILDNCPHLEYLDIRQCLNVDLDESLKKRCAKIKVVKLPRDSTEDYQFLHRTEDELLMEAYEEQFLLEDDGYEPYDDFTLYDYFDDILPDECYEFYNSLL